MCFCTFWDVLYCILMNSYVCMSVITGPSCTCSESQFLSNSSPVFRTQTETPWHGQTFSGGIAWLVSLAAPLPRTHLPIPVCLPPLSSSFSLPFFPQHLAVLSRGAVSGSASQASPLLVILHQPWSKRRTGIHLIRPPTSPCLEFQCMGNMAGRTTHS